MNSDGHQSRSIAQGWSSQSALRQDFNSRAWREGEQARTLNGDPSIVCLLAYAPVLQTALAIPVASLMT
jgi:hypothetical protein